MLKPNTRLASAALFTNFRPQDITLLRIVAFTNGVFKYSSVHYEYLKNTKHNLFSKQQWIFVYFD